jgi:hypothetical protein
MWKHGRYSKEMVDLRRAVRRLMEEAKEALRSVRAGFPDTVIASIISWLGSSCAWDEEATMRAKVWWPVVVATVTLSSITVARADASTVIGLGFVQG